MVWVYSSRIKSLHFVTIQSCCLNSQTELHHPNMTRVTRRRLNEAFVGEVHGWCWVLKRAGIVPDISQDPGHMGIDPHGFLPLSTPDHPPLVLVSLSRRLRRRWFLARRRPTTHRPVQLERRCQGRELWRGQR